MTVAACLGASEATPHVWWWQGASAAGAPTASRWWRRFVREVREALRRR